MFTESRNDKRSTKTTINNNGFKSTFYNITVLSLTTNSFETAATSIVRRQVVLRFTFHDQHALRTLRPFIDLSSFYHNIPTML